MEYIKVLFTLSVPLYFLRSRFTYTALACHDRARIAPPFGYTLHYNQMSSPSPMALPFLLTLFRVIIENFYRATRTLDLVGIERKAETAGKSGSMLLLHFCNLAVEDKKDS